jgi:hypothetical protein
MMKKCDCWLGMFHSYEYNDEDNLELSKIRTQLSGLRFEPKDYLDRRKGLSTMFNFCPWCGLKINWRDIKKSVQAPPEEG